jgi:hypothetical protein
MWLKIEHHRNHESARINANSNPGSGRRGDLVSASSPSRIFLNSFPPQIAQILNLDRFLKPSPLTPAIFGFHVAVTVGSIPR